MSVPTQHVEPMVDSCVAALRAELNTAIDAINLEGGVQLEHVPVSAYYPGGLVSTVSVSWPFVEVSVADASYDAAAIQQAAWDAHATGYVSLWCRSAVSDEDLYRSTLRYGRALLSILLAPDAFGAELYVDSVRVAYRRNPEAAAQDQALEAAALVVCTIGGDEAPG